MTSVAALTACARSGVALSSAETWLLDDGVMELTPEYNVQYVQDEANSQAIAAFHHLPSKKLVRLRPGASISVNGKVLEEVLGRHGAYFYSAQLATTEGTFNFTLTRAPGHAMTHRFELPQLGLSDLPKVYRPYEKLLVPVKYTEPPQYVVRDSYSMAIYGPSLRFDLTSSTRRKDNRYEFDRLPDIQDGAILFTHIIDSAPQPGMYAAAIYRQHHVVLNKLSDTSATGWAKLTNTQALRIEIK
jgi:hypothetical protein